jgi:hypothetical protein
MSSPRFPFRAPIALSLAAAGALACSEVATAPESASTLGPPSSPEASDVIGATAASATRAMKVSARVSFIGEIVPPDAPCLQQLSSAILGNATHLGRFEGVGSTCILDVVAPDPDPPFAAPGAPPYATAAFSNPLWVLTAANGDELWLRTVEATAVCRLENFSQCRVSGTHVIIGGTGRFAGATGELSSRAINEDGEGPDDFESRGWILY